MVFFFLFPASHSSTFFGGVPVLKRVLDRLTVIIIINSSVLCPLIVPPRLHRTFLSNSKLSAALLLDHSFHTPIFSRTPYGEEGDELK